MSLSAPSQMRQELPSSEPWFCAARFVDRLERRFFIVQYNCCLPDPLWIWSYGYPTALLS